MIFDYGPDSESRSGVAVLVAGFVFSVSTAVFAGAVGPPPEPPVAAYRVYSERAAGSSPATVMTAVPTAFDPWLSPGYPAVPGYISADLEAREGPTADDSDHYRAWAWRPVAPSDSVRLLPDTQPAHDPTGLYELVLRVQAWRFPTPQTTELRETRVLQEGWEGYSVVSDCVTSQWSFVTDLMASLSLIAASGGMGGAQSLQIDYDGANAATVNKTFSSPGPIDAGYMRAYIRVSTFPTATGFDGPVLCGTYTLPSLTTFYTIRLREHRLVVGTGAGPNTVGTYDLQADTLYRLEWTIDRSTSPTTQTLRLYAGRTSTLLETITHVAGTAAISSFRLGDPSGYSPSAGFAYVVAWDDISMDVDAMPVADAVILTSRPAAAGVHNDWTVVGESNAWEAVDEVTADDDTTYIESQDFLEEVSVKLSAVTVPANYRMGTLFMVGWQYLKDNGGHSNQYSFGFLDPTATGYARTSASYALMGAGAYRIWQSPLESVAVDLDGYTGDDLADWMLWARAENVGGPAPDIGGRISQWFATVECVPGAVYTDTPADLRLAFPAGLQLVRFIDPGTLAGVQALHYITNPPGVAAVLATWGEIALSGDPSDPTYVRIPLAGTSEQIIGDTTLYGLVLPSTVDGVTLWGEAVILSAKPATGYADRSNIVYDGVIYVPPEPPEPEAPWNPMRLRLFWRHPDPEARRI